MSNSARAGVLCSCVSTHTKLLSGQSALHPVVVHRSPRVAGINRRKPAIEDLKLAGSGDEAGSRLLTDAKLSGDVGRWGRGAAMERVALGDTLQQRTALLGPRPTSHSIKMVPEIRGVERGDCRSPVATRMSAPVFGAACLPGRRPHRPGSRCGRVVRWSPGTCPRHELLRPNHGSARRGWPEEQELPRRQGPASRLHDPHRSSGRPVVTTANRRFRGIPDRH